MDTKTPNSTPPEAPSVGNPMPLNLMANLGQQQLALMVQSACAMFRGSQAIREIQKEAAHQAEARHEEAAQKLRGPCKPADLASIQSDLLRLDIQEATQYWQHLGAAMLKTQVEMMGSVNQVLSNGADSQGAYRPLIDVWQSMTGRSFNGSTT